MPWAPQGGTEWVLPIGGGSVTGDPDAGLGALIWALPAQGGGTWHRMAPALRSEIAADMQFITAAAQGNCCTNALAPQGERGKWDYMGRGQRGGDRGTAGTPQHPPGGEGGKAPGMGTPVRAGLRPRAHPVSVMLGARRLVCQPVLDRRRCDAPGNRLRRHVTCVSG